MEAVILAGGLGTRLGSLVRETPKPLLPVGKHPLLFYLVEQLKRQGIIEIVCLIGYQADKIQEYLKDGRDLGVHIQYAVEKELLGTGGAIKAALSLIKKDTFFIVNGDTFFNISFAHLEAFHKVHKAPVSLALKYLEGTRYGIIESDKNDRITRFYPKGHGTQEGLINGGIYIVQKEIFNQLSQNKFSIESDLFPLLCEQKQLYGLLMEGEFIDIGVPDDYARAQTLVPKWSDSA